MSSDVPNRICFRFYCERHLKKRPGKVCVLAGYLATLSKVGLPGGKQETWERWISSVQEAMWGEGGFVAQWVKSPTLSASPTGAPFVS